MKDDEVGSKYWLISNIFYFSSFIRKNEIKGKELKRKLKESLMIRLIIAF